MAETIRTPMRWRTFELPKSGSLVEEFEDALAGNPAIGRFAVADGATESVCADVWAKLLVAGYLACPVSDTADWTSWLTPLRRLWWDEIASRNLPWYAEHKLDAGAAAAMVGLAILPDATWRAIAVGDSCLFHIRAGELIRAFPLSRSDEFDNRPELIESRPPATESEPRQISGELQAGDQLLMMTDAVARWFLSEAEVHHIPSPVIQRLFDLHDSPDQQAAEINQLRTSHVLRNDDVALQLIEF